MRKLFLVFVNLCLILSCFGFVSCREKSASAQASKAEKITVLASVFPAYDWARNLAAGSDNVSVDLLLKDGVDLHSYQPSAKDIVKISTADIFIYVGGESDQWVGDALKNAGNENQIVINLMEVLKGFVKEEEVVEGMQAEDESGHENEGHEGEAHVPELAGHEHEERAEREFDEHVWLSLNNAIASSNEIARALMERDESNAQIYMANLVSYVQALSSLKEAYANEFGGKTIIVCDRFPFRYLTDEFGIKYYAAFTGCSAETEASFETIAFLAKKCQELNAKAVFVTESADKKIARTVISSANRESAPIVTLDSMQSVTLKQAKKGANYLDIMRSNLEALK
ncbi:MAG: zinc ABC transporter substrate-binding protein [Treponema sp.]|uniref:metal ABC transporter substrate-binding protein n=1 Tax=Treponema sp. TaxID=166 RepID=UPI0025EDB36A|nr:metal ABC transporter substrate-binding protein [Treponema sp.]MBQ9282914.1 zinc ABC transporter substrate-binding protein [Treponema sp.]